MQQYRPMSSLAHIVVIAVHMHDRCGPDAQRLARQRTDQNREHADFDGASMWRRVALALSEIQRLQDAN